MIPNYSTNTVPREIDKEQCKRKMEIMTSFKPETQKANTSVTLEISKQT